MSTQFQPRPSVNFNHAPQTALQSNYVQTQNYQQRPISQTNTGNFYRQSIVQPVINQNNNVLVTQNHKNVHHIAPVSFNYVSNPVVVQTRTYQQQPIIQTQQKRFQTYQKPAINDYKYNLFSAIDEPWNRCLQLGKCGKCPGNQFIAKQLTRRVWNEKK